jgi:homoserine dehydrogenase
MAGDIIVLKFGGSVLRSQADVPAAVHEIYRWYRAGWRVVAIAASSDDSPALLGTALDRVGVPARVIDPRSVGLTMADTSLDSDASAVHADHFKTLLEYTPVLVVAGFGYDADGCLQLSGRGGSDHSAVYLANALRANRCRLLEDVDGVYESDPAAAAPSSSLQRFSALGYADALELATSLIEPRAVQLLNRYSARAEVAAIASPYESVIGRFGRTPAHATPSVPTSVLVLGLGEIGQGIYRRAAEMTEHFNVIGALVRDRDKYARSDCNAPPLFDSLEAMANLRPDVVIDALPGHEPSRSLVSHFLERGISVVSSNTALVAEAGRALSKLAASCNAYLHYSAAVGGSAPMMEALRREIHHGDIRSVAAVFSGAASHILDRWAKGFSLEELLLNAAAESGAAALDEQLSGASSVRKLRLLARHAFGSDPDALHADSFDAQALARVRDSSGENCTLRLVARAWKISHRVFGQLQLEALDTRDPLAQVQPEWNRLLITRSNGQEVVVQGRGGGRWPTTEALMADLLDVRFAHLALARPAIPDNS